MLLAICCCKRSQFRAAELPNSVHGLARSGLLAGCGVRSRKRNEKNIGQSSQQQIHRVIHRLSTSRRSQYGAPGKIRTCDLSLLTTAIFIAGYGRLWSGLYLHR